MFINDALAQTGAATGGSSGMLLQLVLIFAIFYFLLIRPQQKKLKKHEELVMALKNGDMIITGGGVYAKVVDASDSIDLMVEIAANVVVKVNRGTVREVIVPQDNTKAVKESTKSKAKAKAPKKVKPANANKAK